MMNVPVDHLEHPEEYSHWFDYLKERFDTLLDADDTIISYLYQNGMLIKGKEIEDKDSLILKSKSDRMLKFLSKKSQEIDALIRNLSGYIGSREINSEKKQIKITGLDPYLFSQDSLAESSCLRKG